MVKLATGQKAAKAYPLPLAERLFTNAFQISIEAGSSTGKICCTPWDNIAMSVAFRRESDEEHKEPRFELPIPPGPNLVTPAGLAQTAARVEELESQISGETEETRLAELKRDLRYWRTRLATAQAAPPPPKDRVAFGSCVTFSLKGTTRTITIVGDDEADPACGRISFSAPLCRALAGTAVGDFADFAGEEEAIEILEIAQSY